MTEELELEQTAAAESPKPKLVEAKPVAPTVPAHPKRRLSRWLVLLALLGVAAGGVKFWLQSRGFEATDDAQVDGHFHSVSARISGTVIYVNPKAENNQFVEAGTLLVELDPRDYEAELDHAKADLDTRKAESLSAQVTVPIVDASAFSRVRASEAAAQEAIATVSEAEANLAAAQHRLLQDQAASDRAERDRVRYQALVEKHEISRSEYDARQTEAVSTAQAVQADLAAIQSSQQKIAQAKSLVAQREAELEGDTLYLEGEELKVIELGHTDTSHSTALFVPSIGLVVSGDAVYNNTHPYLAECDDRARTEWLRALDTIEALNPQAVVAGHGVMDPDSSPRHIDETRRYLRDFDAAGASTSTAPELYEKMLALHPNRVNPGSLWGAAKAAEKS